MRVGLSPVWQQTIFFALALALLAVPLVVSLEWVVARYDLSGLLFDHDRTGISVPLRVMAFYVAFGCGLSWWFNHRRAVVSPWTVLAVAGLGYLLLTLQVWDGAHRLTFRALDVRAILTSWELLASYASLATAVVVVPIVSAAEPSLWLRRHWWVIPAALAATALGAYGLMIVHKWASFGLPARDVAMFDQAIWHLSRFEAPASTIRGYANLWADHFHPIILFLVPLVWLSSSVLTLYLAQVVVVVAGALPAFAIARKATGSLLFSSAVSVTYLLYGGLQHALNFGFYPELLGIPLTLGAVWALIEGHRRWFWIAVVLVLMTKEDAGLALTLLGLAIATVRGWRRTGFTLAVIAFIWTLVAVKLVIPAFNPGGPTYQYWSYDAIGSTPTAFVQTVITQPIRTLEVLTHPEAKLQTITHTMADVAFVPILSPLVLTGASYLAENFLSNRPALWIYGFHYQALILPFLVLATIDATCRISRWLPHATLTVGLVLLTNAWLQPYLGQYPLYRFYHEDRVRVWSNESSTWTLLARIPPTAIVSAQGPFATVLDRRATIYDYPNGVASADYLVLSTRHNEFPLTKATIAADIARFRTDPAWRLVSEANGVVLFTRVDQSISSQWIRNTNP